jgi:hypothetical protein
MSSLVDTHTVSISMVTFLLAGFVKGVAGLGLPTVAMGLLSTVMAPAKAASLLIVPSFGTNVWQLFAGPHFASLARRLGTMMLGVIVGTLAGTGFMQGDHGETAITCLGIALIAYAVLNLAAVSFKVPVHWEWWLGPVIGLVTGLVTAATGVFVIPAVPYLGALGLAKDELIQALGLSATVSTVALAISLAGGGSLEVASISVSTLALAPALAGMFMGGWVRGRVTERVFRRCFFVGLLLLGMHLALQSIL